MGSTDQTSPCECAFRRMLPTVLKRTGHRAAHMQTLTQRFWAPGNFCAGKWSISEVLFLLIKKKMQSYNKIIQKVCCCCFFKSLLILAGKYFIPMTLRAPVVTNTWSCHLIHMSSSLRIVLHVACLNERHFLGICLWHCQKDLLPSSPYNGAVVQHCSSLVM